MTAYFFCNAGDIQKRKFLPLLATWIWQLLQERKELLSLIQERFLIGERSNVSGVEDTLQRIVVDEMSSRLVLDGLDEGESADR